jgi:TetR/AcrR family transcriptional regulator, cholesterol catabolism regulator
MSRPAGRDAPKRIIEAVVELLRADGYDAVQLREVARRAHVSLATVYKLFPTRDVLIVAALEHWMAANAYPDLMPPAPDETLHDGLIRVLRHVLEPWERNPRMLEAFHRARSEPGGPRLDAQGFDVVLPVAAQIFGGADPEYIVDVGTVLVNVTFALIGQVADGTLGAAEMLPILDRILRRLTADNEPAARAAVEGRGAPGEAPPPDVTSAVRVAIDWARRPDRHATGPHSSAV